VGGEKETKATRAGARSTTGSTDPVMNYWEYCSGMERNMARNLESTHESQQLSVTGISGSFYLGKFPQQFQQDLSFLLDKV
jgi:hypothetical protein